MKQTQMGFIFTILLTLSSFTFASTVTAPSQNSLLHYKQFIASFYHLQPKNLDLLAVNGYQQTTEYTCGPAAVMSLLHYYGLLSDTDMNHKTELKIATEMGTSDKTGTSPQQIVKWLKEHGFTVTAGENGSLTMLRDNLKKGIPTLVEWMDWGGHWVVVTGYETRGKTPSDDLDTILLADPAAITTHEKTTHGIISFNPDRFDNMWFDAQFFNPGHLVKGVYIIAVPTKK
ncbi:MAG: peptidase C39 family protein [Gammaproteobacteria bacterium]|nr:peptidase C39 family protein [Gammaproteobacteria bacterium]